VRSKLRRAAACGALLLLPAAPAAAQPASAQPGASQPAPALPAPAQAASAQPAPAAPAAPQPMTAQPAPAQPGAELTVFHAIFAQGDQVWEKFGHNAIWIHDAASGTTTSYNYGMFSFDQPGFIPRLMRGDMLYSMGVRDADEELAAYAYFNRSVTVQRLNLAPAQAHALREFLEWNWLPENRDYLYDYFRDNCSTRVRDALDRALGGAIRAGLADVPTGSTFRSHSLRLTEGSGPTVAGLLLGLGPPTDRPIDAWEESFIPMQLQLHLRSVRVPDGAGGAVPLVAEERVLHQATRPAEATAAPNPLPGYLLAGLLVAALLAGLGHLARTGRRAAFGLAVAISLWGVFSGAFGVVLLLLWAATNHVYSYGNLNLLQANPLGLLLAVAAPLAILRRTTGLSHASMRLAWPVAVTLAFLSAVGLLLHLLPVADQANGPIIALALPIHAGVVLALYQAIPRAVSPAGDSSPGMELPTTA
jgi:hypothetical protein